MGVYKLKGLKELIEFLPLLVKNFKNFDIHWNATTHVEDFAAKIIDCVDFAHYYATKTDNELNYFLALIPDSPTCVTIYFFYVNPKYHEQTRNILAIVKDEMKSLGFTEAIFATSRMTRSYDRWVKKQGAQQTAVIYKIKNL